MRHIPVLALLTLCLLVGCRKPAAPPTPILTIESEPVAAADPVDTTALQNRLKEVTSELEWLRVAQKSAKGIEALLNPAAEDARYRQHEIDALRAAEKEAAEAVERLDLALDEQLNELTNLIDGFLFLHGGELSLKKELAAATDPIERKKLRSQLSEIEVQLDELPAVRAATLAEIGRLQALRLKAVDKLKGATQNLRAGLVRSTDSRLNQTDPDQKVERSRSTLAELEGKIAPLEREMVRLQAELAKASAK